jgi:hypothetical protein
MDTHKIQFMLPAVTREPIGVDTVNTVYSVSDERWLVLDVDLLPMIPSLRQLYTVYDGQNTGVTLRIEHRNLLSLFLSSEKYAFDHCRCFQSPLWRLWRAGLLHYSVTVSNYFCREKIGRAPAVAAGNETRKLILHRNSPTSLAPILEGQNRERLSRSASTTNNYL